VLIFGSDIFSMVTGTPTLHDPGVVGREPQPVLCDIDVHLVCKVDGLEELVQRPRGAGDSPENGRGGSRALALHGDVWMACEKGEVSGP